MVQSQLTRRNHYVPVWYQKGFYRGSRNKLHYLDLNPPRTTHPDGRTVFRKSIDFRSPKRCFRETDLYTTRFGPALTDHVERFLFGPIDTRGASAVRAFASGHPRTIHATFQDFFEYLNAQKLRTPKGLDWIKTRYASLTQGDLMQEMQHLRYMHCTMWVEGVREIVSADQSDVKFIVTDHPVTAYNSAHPPTSSVCRYPGDPPIHLTGTQTVFALDADHCLILTNLEYAKNPTGIDLLASRQNPRYAGETLARTDTMIRTRRLSSEEVVSINALLKLRARRYLAAYEQAWLFPEHSEKVAWEDIGKVLLPPRDALWGFGGEVYIGYKDGSTQYRDPFGRTDTSHRFLKKTPPPAEPEPTDPCGCGSGRIYRRCCRDMPIAQRPPWDVYSIRDRNRMLCNAITDILGLNEPHGWENMRRRMSDEQVKRIHKILSMLWPRDTGIADLLPRPDKRVFRAVYMGLVDPRTIAVSVVGALAYFDEIIVLNPLPNPLHMRPEFSPTESPGQHKSQTLKNVSVLLTLQPFVDAGMVHLVPDPMDFSADYRRAMTKAMEGRTGNWCLKDDEMRLAKALASDDFKRGILRLPATVLRRMLREDQPDLGTKELEEVVQYMKRELANDPLALRQPVTGGKAQGELQVFRSVSLELALFLAHLTGSTIYTDEMAYWRRLHEGTNADGSVGQVAAWAPLFERLNNTGCSFEADPSVVMKARMAGKLGRVRHVLRRMWQATLSQDDEMGVGEVASRLALRLEVACAKAKEEWARCSIETGAGARFHGKMEVSAPAGGFGMTSVDRLLVTFGRESYIGAVPLALLLTLDDFEERVVGEVG
ncbi:MAG: DUF4238 domain-containing protein [Acidobacteria bacterium]|nr:DUF4238 domain-containing protein [Acidobacteriota bacterium]